MAVHNHRHNGQTYSIETVRLPPDGTQFGCIIFRPHFEQQCYPLVYAQTTTGLPVYQHFSTENAAIEAAINTIRAQTPQLPFLRCFMNQLQESLATIPLGMRRVEISGAALLDWRKLSQNDWEADGWTGEDQDLTSLDRNNDVFLAALRKRLSRIGIADVQLTNVDYMEIVPA